jgi:transcriptional regulator with XRE-family HTH domain
MSLGARIRHTRTHYGITLQELSDKSGLSKGFICQLENDKSSPSLQALEKIAGALTVPMAYLFLTSEERIVVIRNNERPEYHLGQDGTTVQVLSANRRHVKMVMVDLPPGASVGGDSHAHDSDECHLIIEGTARFVQGNESVVLTVGDSLHWNGFVAHRIENCGLTAARVLSVTTGHVEDIMECDECE